MSIILGDLEKSYKKNSNTKKWPNADMVNKIEEISKEGITIRKTVNLEVLN